MSGDSAISAMLAQLAALAKFDAAVARECAPLVEKAAKAFAAAGVNPMTGAAWPPKVGGGRAGPDAARDVHATAIADVVQVTVDGEHVHLHLGRGKSQVARPIIPTPGALVPESYAKAMREGTRLAWSKAVGR